MKTTGSSPRASIAEIPNTAASDRKPPCDTNAPYAADTWPPRTSVPSQRDMGVGEFVARATSTSPFKPARVLYGPGNTKQNRLDRDVARTGAPARASGAAIGGRTADGLRIMLLATSKLNEEGTSAKEPAMDRSDGWSKSRVDGSSVSRRSLNYVDSSVAPMESSPTDKSDTSIGTAVPTSSITVPKSTLDELLRGTQARVWRVVAARGPRFSSEVATDEIRHCSTNEEI